MRTRAFCLLTTVTLACAGPSAKVHAGAGEGIDSGPAEAEALRDVATIQAPAIPDASRADAPPSVPPLDASAGAWTWVDVPGSSCADGTPTGFAINPAPAGSPGLLLFLEGGGACWDATTCWGPVSTAFYVQTGYDQLAFETDPQVAAIYLLDRANPANPFAAMNMVYVPYCTGDVFAGNRVTTLSYLGIGHETHFVGYENLGLYLEYVRSTFPGANRVWLAGDSAGGFGAALNFDHVQRALPNARVDVLDDSGQPIEPAPGLWSTWTAAWNVQLPQGCTACATSVGAFVDEYRTLYPGHRFGLVSYEYDTVISTFMGLSLPQFQTELYGLAAHVDATWPDARYFVLPGASHVGLLLPTPALVSWVQAMVTDSPSWASSKP
jgi:hypothetical protein